MGSAFGQVWLFSHHTNSAGPARRLHRFFPQEYPVSFLGSQPEPQSQLLRVPRSLPQAASPSTPPLPPPPLPSTKPTASDLLKGRQHSVACFEINTFQNLLPAPQRSEKHEWQKQDIICINRYKCVYAHLPDHVSMTSSSVPKRKPTTHEEVRGRRPEAHAQPLPVGSPRPYLQVGQPEHPDLLCTG